MEESATKQEVLTLLNRENFKNISTSEVISLVSRVKDMSPDLQKELIKMFPEVAQYAIEQGNIVKSELESTLKSDDDSLKQVFSIYDKGLDLDKDGKLQYQEMVKGVLNDLSKQLEDPNISKEERDAIYDRQISALKMYDEFENESKKHEKEILQMADAKDSEKRKGNLEMLKIASTITALLTTGALAVLGISHYGKKS